MKGVLSIISSSKSDQIRVWLDLEIIVFIVGFVYPVVCHSFDSGLADSNRIKRFEFVHCSGITNRLGRLSISARLYKKPDRKLSPEIIRFSFSFSLHSRHSIEFVISRQIYERAVARPVISMDSNWSFHFEKILQRNRSELQSLKREP